MESDIPEFFEERDLLGQVKPKHHITAIDGLSDLADHKSDLTIEYAGLRTRLIAYFLDFIFLQSRH